MNIFDYIKKYILKNNIDLDEEDYDNVTSEIIENKLNQKILKMLPDLKAEVINNPDANISINVDLKQRTLEEVLISFLSLKKETLNEIDDLILLDDFVEEVLTDLIVELLQDM